jgi:hypothetical protein
MLMLPFVENPFLRGLAHPPRSMILHCKTWLVTDSGFFFSSTGRSEAS